MKIFINLSLFSWHTVRISLFLIVLLATPLHAMVQTASKSALTAHKRTLALVARSTNNICPVCQYQAESRSALILHIRTHTGERPFVCKICKEAFTQKGNLNRHMTKHTGKKSFVCDRCGKSFARSDKVLQHKRNIHEKEDAAKTLLKLRG